MSKNFRGSYTVAVTPFRTPVSPGIDLEAQRAFLDWQIASGVPGVIVLGTTGEFLSVSDDERNELIEATVQHCAGRIDVLVGAMNAHTPIAARFAREAEELGADGLMILPPYYNTPTEDEIFGYYATICEATSLPIMLYNNPVTSNVDMPAHLVTRLARNLPNVRYIKEASQDVGRVFDLVQACGDDLDVFAGERIVESFLLGAVGYVNPYGNYVPRSSSAIWDLLVAGRVDDAKEVQGLLDAMDHTIAAGHPAYGHQCYAKALAEQAGYPMGDVRAPLTTFRDLGDEGKRRLAVLADLQKQLEELPSVRELRPDAPVTSG